MRYRQIIITKISDTQSSLLTRSSKLKFLAGIIGFALLLQSNIGLSQTMPSRGETQDQVTEIYGEPETKLAPVGVPAIIQWKYSDFTVYFENRHVIHSVSHDQRLKVKGPTPKPQDSKPPASEETDAEAKENSEIAESTESTAEESTTAEQTRKEDPGSEAVDDQESPKEELEEKIDEESEPEKRASDILKRLREANKDKE